MFTMQNMFEKSLKKLAMESDDISYYLIFQPYNNTYIYLNVQLYKTTERTEPLLLLFEFVPFPGDLSVPRIPPVHLSPSVTTADAGSVYKATSSQHIRHTLAILNQQQPKKMY